MSSNLNNYYSEIVITKMLFNLPPEVVNDTLSFIEPNDLNHLFQLDNLVNHNNIYINDPFNFVQNMALFQYFNNKEVIVTNRPTSVYHDNISTLIIRSDQLNYLISRHIIIKPKVISFVLFNDNDTEDILSLVDLNYFKLIDSNFNIKMVFVKKFNFFSQVLINKFFIEYFKVFEDRLNWFTIKDHVDVHFDNLYSFNHLINIENLQLHMFNSKKLIQHLSSTVVPDPMTASSFGLLYSNLKSLDLSYNTLNDLTSIKFPSSLEYLNLSNNNIINLNNSTFNWKNLTNLKYLNLSNNTLVSFNLFNTISSNEFIEKEEYNLQKIDLSGNNLINLNFLSSKACVLFKNLTTIDLSRNLISDLVKFTGSLRSINLTGNYLDELNESHFDFSYYFPSNMTEINLSYCKLHNTNQIESELIKACPGLTKLNLEGNSKLPKIEVTPSA